MINKLFAVLCIVLLGLLFACENQTTSNFSTRKLEKRLKEAKKLNLELKQKVTEIKGAKAKFVTGNNKHLKIITDIKKNKRINNLEQALDNQKVHNSLKIIQNNKIYINVLDQKRRSLRQGIVELDYYEEKFDNDLTFAQVVGNEQIDKLVDEITSFLDKYQDEVDRPIMNEQIIKGSKKIRLKSIWDSIDLEYEKLQKREKKELEKQKQERRNKVKSSFKGTKTDYAFLDQVLNNDKEMSSHDYCQKSKHCLLLSDEKRGIYEGSFVYYLDYITHFDSYFIIGFAVSIKQKEANHIFFKDSFNLYDSTGQKYKPIFIASPEFSSAGDKGDYVDAVYNFRSFIDKDSWYMTRIVNAGFIFLVFKDDNLHIEDIKQGAKLVHIFDKEEKQITKNLTTKPFKAKK